MTQLALLDGTETQTDLATFFADLAQCRDTNSSTHGFHPYPAKFIPHIPRELIRAYSVKGEMVWDPMCGSGTTLVEAALEGRDAVGADINPIAVLAAEAKTTPLSPQELLAVRDLADRLARAAVEWRPGASGLALPELPNRDHWFEADVSEELVYARDLIGRLESPTARNFALCAFSAIVVPVSNQESETRWCAKPRQVPAGSVLAKLAGKLRSAAQSVEEFSREASGQATVYLRDAREAFLPDDSVHFAITSPPYANSHDYYLYNKLRMFWLGYDVRAVQAAEVGSRNRHSDHRESIDTYFVSLFAVLERMRSALLPGRHAAIVVGDAVIRKEFFAMDVHVPEIAREVGLELVETFSFEHRRFNRAFQRGFGTSREKATHVLVFLAP